MKETSLQLTSRQALELAEWCKLEADARKGLVSTAERSRQRAINYLQFQTALNTEWWKAKPWILSLYGWMQGNELAGHVITVADLLL